MRQREKNKHRLNNYNEFEINANNFAIFRKAKIEKQLTTKHSSMTIGNKNYLLKNNNFKIAQKQGKLFIAVRRIPGTTSADVKLAIEKAIMPANRSMATINPTIHTFIVENLPDNIISFETLENGQIVYQVSGTKGIKFYYAPASLRRLLHYTKVPGEFVVPQTREQLHVSAIKMGRLVLKSKSPPHSHSRSRSRSN